MSNFVKRLFKKPAIPQTNFRFKIEKTFEERRRSCEHLLKRYPNKVPLIIETSHNSNIGELKNKKFIVKPDTVMAQLNYLVRKNIDGLTKNESLLLWVANKELTAMTTTIGSLYEKHKDQDGYLYIRVSKENTFGM